MKIFVTAALGTENYRQAALRLTQQVSKLNIFDKLVIVDDREVDEICKYFSEWYPGELRKNSYKFSTWKPSIATAAFNGRWGDCDLVCYLDAGCDVIPNRIGKRKFLELCDKSQKHGVVAFTINTPELQYSKSDLFNYFPNLEKLDNSPQFQAGSWLLSGDIGESFARDWENLMSLSPSMSNDVLSNEHPDFVAPRFDQSLFSLLLKSKGVLPTFPAPPFPRKSILSKLRHMDFPIWWSRNLSGDSFYPRFALLLSRLLK